VKKKKSNVFILVGFLSVLLLSFSSAFSQLVQPFDIRYQTQQKGGIVFLSNVSVSCNSGSNCIGSTSSMPVTGNTSYGNNDFVMNYVDIDGDPSTYMSTSDSLNLQTCSEILWAGLYWGSRVNSSTTNFSQRHQVKVKTGSGNYQTLLADQMIDFTGPYTTSYYGFKNITNLVQLNGINTRYTIADMVSENDYNCWGGWTIVVVYKNVAEAMRNLTVFDGFANISDFGSVSYQSVDIPINGFVTPPSGPVNFELGVVAYDGDRQSTGDQMKFNGSGSFINIQDQIHSPTNLFNSTISYGGSLTSFRIPSLNNTLGQDANIFLPDNTSFSYLPNNATSGIIRVSTGGESILAHVVTSVIDVYEPDLRATVYIDDLNGGIVHPGDTLEYTIVGKNIGSDLSVNTFISDTLDIRTDYLTGSLKISSGPNSGIKTDQINDDQGEYDPLTRSITVRIGSGANTLSGGEVLNDIIGTDSTVIKYKVVLVNDCLILQCDSVLDDEAFIFGTGNISGNQSNNGGLSDLYDINGCPISSPTPMFISTGNCPNIVIQNNGPLCEGDSLFMSVPSMNTPLADSLANYQWFGPNGFFSSQSQITIHPTSLADTGVYGVQMTFTGLSCILSFDTDTISIFEDPLAAGSIPPNASCDGLTVQFDNSSVSASSYFWDFGVPNIANDISVLFEPSYTYPQAGIYSVLLIASSSSVCADTILFDVTVNEDLTISISHTDSLCIVDNSYDFLANASGPSSAVYEWNFGSNATPSSSNQLSVNGVNFDTSGVFPIQFIGSYDVCSDTVNSSIFVYAEPQIDFAYVNSLQCAPSTAQFINLSASDTPPIYSWTFGDGQTSTLHSPSHIYNNVGTYSVGLTMITTEGCIDTLYLMDQDLVSVYPSPEAGFMVTPNQTDICEAEVEFIDQSLGADSYYYVFDHYNFISTQANFVHNYTLSGSDYPLQVVTNIHGCKDSIRAQLFVEPFALYVPNTFIPDEDGINDLFYPVTDFEIIEWDFSIYNKWGERVFYSIEYGQYWDGSFKGQKCPDGTYIYQIKYKSCANPHAMDQINGHVNLLR